MMTEKNIKIWTALEKETDRVATQLFCHLVANCVRDKLAVGRVSCEELARFAASVMVCCPKCFAKYWGNPDCDYCQTARCLLGRNQPRGE